MANDPGTLSLNEEIAQLAAQLQQLQSESQAAAASKQLGSRATAAEGSSGASVESTLLNVFGGGLSLSPLISGIAKLFGGGDTAAPPPLTRFALPPAIQASAGVSESGGQAFAVDNPQGGLPRALSTSGSTPQITVQVQAMDSQSFLDHSRDIAMAVRQAMLDSSVLNDVVREA